LRHFAFDSKKDGLILLKEAIKILKKYSKTYKLILYIAKSEKHLNFYKKSGFTKEGTLKHHFRWSEDCYIYSKYIN
jgi:ribosomal protein S18 acetylase RimI-like enzyme